jgi:hypothetical protein
MSFGNVGERRGSNKPGSELPAPPEWISFGNLGLEATRKDPAATRSNTSRRLFEERWRCRNTGTDKRETGGRGEFCRTG